MRIKFQAGSYQFEDQYIRSIARYFDRSGENLWELDTLLVNIAKKYESGDEAAMHAKVDIDHARVKAMENRGTYTMDHFLSALGYQKISEE